jgi:uncharacterized protein YndB with AHSA1/START domain
MQGDLAIAGQLTTLVVTLTSDLDGTLVSVEHSGFTSDQAERRNAEGWARALEGLAAYLQGIPPTT